MRNVSLQLPYPLSRSSRNRRRMAIISGNYGEEKFDCTPSLETDTSPFASPKLPAPSQVSVPSQQKKRSTKLVSRLPAYTGLSRLLQKDQSLLWVFAGDGMSLGEQKIGGTPPFSNLFAEFLHSGLHRLQDDVVNIASSTETAEHLFDNIEECVLRLLPDVVSITLSFNDCIKTRAQQKLFRIRLVNIIETIRRSSAIPLLHTPHRVDFLRNPQLTGLPTYVKIIREIAREEEVPSFDHWDYWKALSGDRDQLAKHLVEDGMHLNSKGNIAVTQLMTKRICKECGLPDECDLFSKSALRRQQVSLTTTNQHPVPVK